MSSISADSLGEVATRNLLLWDPAAPFCPVCGSLLVFPNSGNISCDSCPYEQPMASLSHAHTETRSFPKPPPEWFAEWQVLRMSKRGDVPKEDLETAMLQAKGKAKAKRAVIDEECPKCKSPNMEYYSVQQRSADEGE